MRPLTITLLWIAVAGIAAYWAIFLRSFAGGRLGPGLRAGVSTYNLQHDGDDLTAAGLSELAVNRYCLGLAGWLAVHPWQVRRSLDFPR